MDAFGTCDPIQFATQTIPLALRTRGADQQEQNKIEVLKSCSLAEHIERNWMLINHGFNTMICFIQGINELLTEVTLQSQDLYDFLQSLHFLGPGSLLPVKSNIKLRCSLYWLQNCVTFYFKSTVCEKT